MLSGLIKVMSQMNSLLQVMNNKLVWINAAQWITLLVIIGIVFYYEWKKKN